MAYKCEICNKGVMFGHNVSHAKNRTRRIFKPNLRKAKLRLDGEVKRVKVCMKCLRRAKKEGRYVLPQQARVVPKPSIKPVAQGEVKLAKPELEAIISLAKLGKEKEPPKVKEEKRKIEEIIGKKG